MKKEAIFYDALELQDLKKGGVNTSVQNDASYMMDNNQQNQTSILNNEKDALQKQERMTIALKKDVFLFKNIKELQDVTDDNIKAEIQRRVEIFTEQQDHYSHIQKLRIIQCQKDIITILKAFIVQKRYCRQKINPMFKLKQISIKNSHFSGVILKEIIKLFKDNVESIVIEDSYPIGQTRIECLTHLFLKSNVKPKRLPQIKNLSLSLMNVPNDQLNNQSILNQGYGGDINQQQQLLLENNIGQQTQQQLQYNEEKKKYTSILQRIKEDFKLHLIMGENYFRNVIDLETKFLLRQITLQGTSTKVIIDQKCLTLREHYRYFKEYIHLNRDIVEVILFVNIGRVDLYVFKAILAQLRRVKNLKQLCFIRFQAEQSSLRLIKNFLYWRKYDIEEVYFIQCSMNDLDLKFLFQRENLQITDFTLLNKIIINDNPRITKEYMLPILHQLEEWKAERIQSNIYKYPKKLNIFEEDSQYSKPFKLRKRPDIITEGGVMCKENENFLIKYLADFSQNTLVLDQFPLDQALLQTIILLFQLIRTSKSLCRLSLRNTNFLNLSIPLRLENQEIHSFIEEIDLSENSFSGDQKLVNLFSHVNNTYLKILKLQKMDFDDMDFEDLPVIIGLCTHLKILDLSGTKGFKDYTLIQIIENVPNIEELYLRDCEISEQNLSIVNQRLYQEATDSNEEHNRRLKEKNTFQIMEDDEKFLLENLRIVDLSENKDMGVSLVDFLIYANSLSNRFNMNVYIENIDLNEEQIKSFVKILEQKRLINIEIISLSKNYLEKINSQLLSQFLIALVRENKKVLREIIMKDTYLTVEQLLLIDKDVLDKSRLGNIENLDLSGVGQLCQQELCFRGIFTNLSMFAKTVTTLVWDNISLNYVDGIDLSTIIAKFYMLEKFDISNNLYLSDKSIKEIISGLSTLKHLTEFKMQNMGFNEQQMTCLVDALMGRISTASSKYTIDDDFAENSTFQSLQVLDISGNKFCDQNQWKRFFYVILSSQYNKLNTLILKNIHLDDVIAQNLIAVINERHQQLKLQIVDISHNTNNSLSDSVFVSLIDTFSKLKYLRKLYCRNVSLNAYKIQSICSLILSNQMELIDISENGPNNSVQFSESAQQKQVASDYIPSQSLTNLFGCINGSFTYEHLQKILKQQELLDDPNRQFEIIADDENGQKCPSIKSSNIVKLNLSYNGQLSFQEFRKVIKSINYIGSSNICHLTISNCQLNNKLELLNDFLKFKINSLYYLDISHNQIQSKHSQAFLEIISQRFSEQLEYLDISYTDFSDDELFYLSHTLADSFLNLNYADFSGLQHISPKCLQTLLTGLTLASQVSLETLIIKDLKINQKKQDVLVEMFTYNIFKSLRHLDFSQNTFINEDFETFIRSVSISCGQSLKSINLSYCDLNSIAIQSLAKRFYEAGFHVLESLDISGNKVYQSMNVIIPSFEIINLIKKIHAINGKKFRKLFLRDMNLKDIWINDIKDIFEHQFFDSLEVLDLSQNQMDSQNKLIERSQTLKKANPTDNTKKILYLTKESFIPLYEMIHFKFKKTFNYLDFKEMEIEQNEDVLKQLPHIVLKFLKLETFIFSRRVQEFLIEQRAMSQIQFKQKYFGNQTIYQEVIETISQNVRYLDLKAQQLADSTLYSIKNMKQLEYLDLSYNKLITFETVVNTKSCIQLKTLKLFEINSDQMMIQALINLLETAINTIDLTFDFDSISKEYKKKLLEANFRQPIYKQQFQQGDYLNEKQDDKTKGLQNFTTFNDSLNQQGNNQLFNQQYNQNQYEQNQQLNNQKIIYEEPQLQIELVKKNLLNLSYRYLPKDEVIYANNLLYEFLKEEQKINLNLDLQNIHMNKRQIQSLHCIFPIEDFSFEDLKMQMRTKISSGILFLNQAFISKFLQTYPIQPSQEDYVLYFLNERFFQVCKEANIKQIIVDHPLYLIQPLFYSKEQISNIFSAAKVNYPIKLLSKITLIIYKQECGISKIYLDYHIEFNLSDEQLLIQFFDLIPPSSFKFLESTFSFPFIQYIYKTCNEHPYFKNCDIRSIHIKENTDELALIYREKYYHLPELRQSFYEQILYKILFSQFTKINSLIKRLSKKREFWHRIFYFVFDFISRGLYNSDIIAGLSALNEIQISQNLLSVWYSIMIFLLMVQQFVISILFVNIILMVISLVGNYFVEYYCHYKTMSQIPDCFLLIDEITKIDVFTQNWCKYFVSQLIGLNSFFIFFLIRLCFEQEQYIFGFFVLGWIGMCQILKIIVNCKFKVPIPYIIQFEVLSTLYDQLTIENYMIINKSKINRRAINAFIAIAIELFPSLIFYITFLGLSYEFKIMALLGLLCNLLNFIYQISLILMIKPYQINQMDFDVLSDQQQSQIEANHNNFTDAYEQESLNALNNVKTIFKQTI